MKADFSTTFTNLLKAGGGALQSLDSGDIVADDSSSRRRSAETAREARAELADLDAARHSMARKRSGRTALMP